MSSIAGSAFALRVLVILFDTRRDIVVGDQLFYSAQALSNAKGHWFEQPFAWGTPAADHPPLTSLVLTPVTWIGDLVGGTITFQRLVMASIGVIGIVGLGSAARRIAGERVGLVAAVFGAVYANLWLNDVVVMSESLVVTIVAWTIVTLLRWRDDPSQVNAAILALLASAAALTRPEMIFLVPALFVVVVRQRRARTTFLFGATVLAVLTPWIAWNLSRFDEPTFLSTNDGITLAGGHCDEVYFDDPGGWSLDCALAVPVPVGGDASSASVAMRDAAFDYWGDNIDSFPKVAAARLARILSVGHLSSSVAAGESEGRPPWASWMGIVQFWWVVVAAAIGFRRVSHRSVRWMLVTPLGFVIVVAVVANAYVRFRAPAEVGLVILAAIGAVDLIERVRPRRPAYE